MYQSLKEKLDEQGMIKWVEGMQVQVEWIEEAEEELGIGLPDSYVWWLQQYGHGEVDGSEIFTLTAPEYREETDSDLLYQHRLNQQNDWMPKDRLYIFQPDTDEYYFFDISYRNDLNEFAVMHEDVLNDQIRFYADSFVGFLERIMDERSGAANSDAGAMSEDQDYLEEYDSWDDMENDEGLTSLDNWAEQELEDEDWTYTSFEDEDKEEQ